MNKSTFVYTLPSYTSARYHRLYLLYDISKDTLQSPFCSSFTSFTAELLKIFDQPTQGKEPAGLPEPQTTCLLITIIIFTNSIPNTLICSTQKQVISPTGQSICHHVVCSSYVPFLNAESLQQKNLHPPQVGMDGRSYGLPDQGHYNKKTLKLRKTR